MIHELRLGAINFWDTSFNDGEQIEMYFFKQNIIDPLEYKGIKIIKCNPYKEDCDIVFYAMMGDILNLNKCKGNPVFIYYTGENENIHWNNPDAFKNLVNNNYSLSFYDDSDTNLYFPLWQLHYLEYLLNKPIKNINKSKFCTFIISNDGSLRAAETCKWRNEVFNYISENYKKIDSCGKALNNMDNYTLPYDINEEKKFHADYKFNLCFENSYSELNCTYITEKIIHAYIYGVVPIYWGSQQVNKWFNSRSFIDCTNKSKEEIVDIIKFYDTHSSLYNKMLYENPLIQNIDINYIANRLYNFILKLLHNGANN